MSFFFSPIMLAIVGGLMVIIATAWSNFQQDSLQEKLQKKTEEVASLIGENLNMNKGGDSYPLLSPSFDDKNNIIQFDLFNEGKYPLFDLDLYITEGDSLMSTNEHFNEIGSGKSEQNIYSTILPKGINEKKITVTAVARNGETRHIYKCFRSGGTLGVKTEIYRDGKLIKAE